MGGSIYGRRMYDVMRYWDDDQPDWDAVDRDFATAWRATPKWVVSRTLESVGSNTTLVDDARIRCGDRAHEYLLALRRDEGYRCGRDVHQSGKTPAVSLGEVA